MLWSRFELPVLTFSRDTAPDPPDFALTDTGNIIAEKSTNNIGAANSADSIMSIDKED